MLYQPLLFADTVVIFIEEFIANEIYRLRDEKEVALAKNAEMLENNKVNLKTTACFLQNISLF
jgi:hypothetical protein